MFAVFLCLYYIVIRNNDYGTADVFTYSSASEIRSRFITKRSIGTRGERNRESIRQKEKKIIIWTQTYDKFTTKSKQKNKPQNKMMRN